MNRHDKVPIKTYENTVLTLRFYFKCSTLANQERALNKIDAKRDWINKILRGLSDNRKSNYDMIIDLIETLKIYDQDNINKQRENESTFM